MPQIENKMLQVNYIRQNKEEVLERLSVKNFKQPEIVNEVIDLDDERKRLQNEFDNTQAKKAGKNTSKKDYNDKKAGAEDGFKNTCK